MALLADRVKETTTTTGTGTVSLAGAPAGFQSFNTAFANGSLVYYVIQGGAEWEIGIGTTGTGTLARTQVLQSSNADALVPFSAGVKDVFCSYVADRAVTTVDAATLTNKTLDDYTNNIGANSTHFRIKATGTISKGTVVKATGYNPGENAIEVAVVTSATDLVLGISEQALTAGQFGLAVVIGELFDVNTNGLTVGNIIYSNGSGGFTETKPSSGLYQALGWIVRANASNGVIAVNVVAPLYVETATNTANTSVLRDGSGNFAAGTITATAVNATTLDLTNLEVTNIKAKDGTQAIAIADTTGKLTISDGVLLSGLTASQAVFTDGSKNLVSNAITGTGNVVMSASPTLTGTVTAATLNATTLGGTLSTAAQPNVTSVGTLGSLTVSGNVTVDTNTLFVDATNNRVGIGTTSPGVPLDVFGTGAGTLLRVNNATTGKAFMGFANNGTNVGFVGLSGAWEGDSTSDMSLIAETGYGLRFYTNGSPTERLTINTSGNLGLGVTPSATTASRLFEIGFAGSGVTSFGQTATVYTQNAYNNSGWKYGGTGQAMLYAMDAGVHAWYTAPSGTAGNAISFTQAMTLDASGNLLVGATSNPFSARAYIAGSSNTSVALANGDATPLKINFYNSISSSAIGTGNNANELIFYANSATTERARIGANGKWTVDSSISGDVIVNLVNSNSNGFGLRVAGGGANYIASFNDYTGAERMRIDGTTTAGQTALLLWDVDNGTLERVTVGAADSGGTGFKVLRIPN